MLRLFLKKHHQAGTCCCDVILSLPLYMKNRTSFGLGKKLQGHTWYTIKNILTGHMKLSSTFRLISSQSLSVLWSYLLVDFHPSWNSNPLSLFTFPWLYANEQAAITGWGKLSHIGMSECNKVSLVIFFQWRKLYDLGFEQRCSKREVKWEGCPTIS